MDTEINDNTEIATEPMRGKNDGIVGLFVYISNQDWKERYIIGWKPTTYADEVWYGKIKFANSTLNMPKAKLNALREKYYLTNLVHATWQGLYRD